MIDISVTYDELPIWQQPRCQIALGTISARPGLGCRAPSPTGEALCAATLGFRWLVGIRVVRFQRLTRAQGDVLWSGPQSLTLLVHCSARRPLQRRRACAPPPGLVVCPLE